MKGIEWFVFLFLGVPKLLQSDNGRGFNSKVHSQLHSYLYVNYVYIAIIIINNVFYKISHNMHFSNRTNKSQSSKEDQASTIYWIQCGGQRNNKTDTPIIDGR